MSLVAGFARICLARALFGVTLAEDRVYDSSVTPLDELASDGALPLIIVRTDHDRTEADPRMPRVRSRRLNFIIETILAGDVEIAEGTAHVTVPHTDAGMEFALDVMGWQISQALDDPTNAWAELFRTIVGRIIDDDVQHGGSTDKGIRFAARQIIITVDPLQEPERGTDAVPSPWDALVAQMRTDPELTLYGDLLAALLTGDTLPAWQVMQRRLGQTRAVMDAVGLGAIPGGEAEPPTHSLVIVTPRGPLTYTADP